MKIDNKLIEKIKYYSKLLFNSDIIDDIKNSFNIDYVPNYLKQVLSLPSVNIEVSSWNKNNELLSGVYIGYSDKVVEVPFYYIILLMSGNVERKDLQNILLFKSLDTLKTNRIKHNSNIFLELNNNLYFSILNGIDDYNKNNDTYLKYFDISKSNDIEVTIYNDEIPKTTIYSFNSVFKFVYILLHYRMATVLELDYEGINKINNIYYPYYMPINHANRIGAREEDKLSCFEYDNKVTVFLFDRKNTEIKYVFSKKDVTEMFNILPNKEVDYKKIVVFLEKEEKDNKVINAIQRIILTLGINPSIFTMYKSSIIRFIKVNKNNDNKLAHYKGLILRVLDGELSSNVNELLNQKIFEVYKEKYKFAYKMGGNTILTSTLKQESVPERINVRDFLSLIGIDEKELSINKKERSIYFNDDVLKFLKDNDLRLPIQKSIQKGIYFINTKLGDLKTNIDDNFISYININYSTNKNESKVELFKILLNRNNGSSVKKENILLGTFLSFIGIDAGISKKLDDKYNFSVKDIDISNDIVKVYSKRCMGVFCMQNKPHSYSVIENKIPMFLLYRMKNNYVQHVQVWECKDKNKKEYLLIEAPYPRDNYKDFWLYGFNLAKKMNKQLLVKVGGVKENSMLIINSINDIIEGDIFNSNGVSLDLMSDILNKENKLKLSDIEKSYPKPKFDTLKYFNGEYFSTFETKNSIFLGT